MTFITRIVLPCRDICLIILLNGNTRGNLCFSRVRVDSFKALLESEKCNKLRLLGRGARALGARPQQQGREGDQRPHRRPDAAGGPGAHPPGSRDD